VILVKKLTTPVLMAFLLLLPVVLTACPKEDEASTGLAALEAEYSEGMDAIGERQDSLPEMSGNPDSAERAAFRAKMEASNLEYEEFTESFLPRYETLAEEYWGTGAGLEAKLWVMSRADRPVSGEEEEEGAEEARAAVIAEQTDAIFDEYGRSPHMEQLAENSYLLNEEQVEHYLGQLRETSPHANVRAAAIYYPASRKLSQLVFDEMEKFGGPEESERSEEPAEDADPRASIDADLQLLIDEYGDVPMGGSTYGAIAYAHLTAHTEEELAVGQPAPEIIGTTVDGEEIRLTDFLGKVTVIDFWGDW